MVVDGVIERRVDLFDFRQDIGAECAVMGAGLDDVEGGGAAGFQPVGEQSSGENHAEAAADADAGDEVGIFANTLGGCCVIPMLGMVEGGGHVVAEGERAIGLNAGLE